MQEKATIVRWIFSVFIILDTMYQVYGVSTSVNWSIYYEVVHYGTLLTLCLVLAFDKWDKILFHFSAYFALILAIVLSKIGLTRNEFLSEVRGESVYIYGLFIVILLISFLVNKKKK